MSELPPPPVPADCDLREFGFTPIYRARLFGSDFHANTTDSEWRAGVTLWLKSWEQVPAGSLPSDDVGLARLAEFARDLKGWRKVRDGALHGWFQCSDGRFYHEVVAQVVLEAWLKKRKASDKGKAGATKRWHSGNAQTDGTGMPQPSKKMAQALAQAMPSDSNGREGKGIDREGNTQNARADDGLNGKHVPDAEAHEHFERIRSEYPKGIYRDSDWLPAEREVRMRQEEGDAWEVMLEGVRRYAKQCVARGSVGTQYVTQPSRFFHDRHYREPFPLPAAQERKHPEDTGWRPTE